MHRLHNSPLSRKQKRTLYPNPKKEAPCFARFFFMMTENSYSLFLFFVICCCFFTVFLEMRNMCNNTLLPVPVARLECKRAKKFFSAQRKNEKWKDREKRRTVSGELFYIVGILSSFLSHSFMKKNL